MTPTDRSPAGLPHRLLAGLFTASLGSEQGSAQGPEPGSEQGSERDPELDSERGPDRKLDALAPALADHRRRLDSELGFLLDSLRVPDHRLAAIGRAIATMDSKNTPEGRNGLEVTAVNSGGAGGLVALARRSVDGVRLVAVDSTLRDLDDLGQNAERVVTTARDLDPSVSVFVGLPATTRSGLTTGWIRAAETVEAAGLQARLTATGQEPSMLIEQLRALIELDLPFAVELVGGPSPWPLLAAVAALVDDAGTDEAAALLGTVDNRRAAQIVRDFDDATQARTRRRLQRIDGLRVDELAFEGISRPADG